MFNNVLQFVRLGPDDGAVIQTTKDRDFPTGTAQSPQLPKSREQFIDVTRGLLLLLMINSHALFLAGVPKSNFLHSLLWLPQGWVTQCFVILSGFAIGYIYSNTHRKLADSRHRLFQRGKEILIVMFISNVIFLAINYFMKGNISPLSSLDWWQGLFTFHTPYTISAILIPTALLAFLAPLILYGHAKGFTKTILLITIASSFFVAGWQGTIESQPDAVHWLKVFLGHGEVGLNILPLLSYGLIGCSIGIIWIQYPSVPGIVTVVATTGLLGNLIFATRYQPEVITLFKAALGGPVKFCLILAVGLLITYSLSTTPIGGFLALIGKYSLFCFLAHRIALQTLLNPIQSNLSPTPEILFSILFFGTLLFLGGLCWVRNQSPAFSKTLKKAYL